VVQLARHKTSGELYALKLISLYDKVGTGADMLTSQADAEGKAAPDMPLVARHHPPRRIRGRVSPPCRTLAMMSAVHPGHAADGVDHAVQFRLRGAGGFLRCHGEFAASACSHIPRLHVLCLAASLACLQYREGQVAVILEFMNLGGLDNVIRKAPGKCIPEPVLAAMAYQVSAERHCGRHTIPRHPPPPTSLQMLFGLGYLAYERRVHRDIKPQNILASTTGQVKLTDFGISRELSTAVLAKTFIGAWRARVQAVVGVG